MKYTEILVNSNKQNCKPRSSPCEMSSNKRNSEESPLVNNKFYRELAGRLLYVTTLTIPGLCYSVTKLSQHLSAPTAYDLNTAKHVYLIQKLHQKKGLS